MFIQWTEDIAVHHGQIDDEHQQMFDLVNRLHAEMTAAADRDTVGRTLDALVACTQEHFADEESVMQAHEYAHLPEHARKHQALLAQLQTFVDEFRGGKMSITPETMAFLHEWLTQHMRRDDQKLSAFLAGIGSRTA